MTAIPHSAKGFVPPPAPTTGQRRQSPEQIWLSRKKALMRPVHVACNIGQEGLESQFMSAFSHCHASSTSSELTAGVRAPVLSVVRGTVQSHQRYRARVQHERTDERRFICTGGSGLPYSDDELKHRSYRSGLHTAPPRSDGESLWSRSGDFSSRDGGRVRGVIQTGDTVRITDASAGAPRQRAMTKGTVAAGGGVAAAGGRQRVNRAP